MPSRIPTEIDQFNTYIVNTNARQLATNPDTTNPYWTDYGWTSAQSTAYKTNWRDKWVNTVYPKYSDPVQSTGIVKKDTHKFIKDFTTFANDQKLLGKIIACGIANNTDATIWKIVLERAAPSGPPDKIAAQIFAELATLGRGKFDVHVRAEADSTRSSIPRDAGADSVQYAMAIVDRAADAITDPNSPLLIKDISRKAHFDLDAGSANQGKWLVIYFRWYNTSHPRIAGDWSVMILVAIG